jgi:hypothetical protein
MAVTVQTITVHDVGAALYGVWESLIIMADPDTSLLRELESTMALQAGESTEIVTDADGAQLLATFEGWRTAFKLEQPETELDKLSGISLLRKLRRVRKRKARTNTTRAIIQRAKDVDAGRFDEHDEGTGDTDDQEGTGDGDTDVLSGELGFIGVALRGALIGARILFKRVGAQRAMVIVGAFARRASSRVATLFRTDAGKALAIRSAKYLAIGGSIALGGNFAATLAKRVGEGASSVGKGALWLLAAYAAYVFLQNQPKKKYR